ncbi:glutamate-5-semialdehyde dehydrogenase [Peptococcus simiae]|uniref:glutamate-5-semialdehyde dehydrogenase n=1 Tax=Peptococcus simiae TaxID=1643805 RepID=UPI00397F5410
MSLEQMARNAKAASKVLALSDQVMKNNALSAMAEALLLEKAYLQNENNKDMQAGREANMSEALLDRLLLTDARIEDMAKGLKDLCDMPDPIGQVTESWRTENGLQISRQSVPLGVILMIYEARPNVTADAAGLCLKSGNAVILRGSRSAIHSNVAIASVLKRALADTGIPTEAIQLVEDVSHEAVGELLRMNDWIDLAIPRGGAGLIKSVVSQASIPVIETGTGNCHLYVDAPADLNKALAITMNGKVQRPGVCNALETLLVHKDVADAFLPMALEALKTAGVNLRGCDQTMTYGKEIAAATEEDYATEFHDLILAVRVVDSFADAVSHINRYSSGHSDVIVTDSYSHAQAFLNEIDSACVYVNASSRFSDGSQFGFGAEIGISTQKMHARGPMGIQALTSYKYTICGKGQIRE